jgi:hypothetical protein
LIIEIESHYSMLDVPAYRPPVSDGKVNAAGGAWRTGLLAYLSSKRAPAIAAG